MRSNGEIDTMRCSRSADVKICRMNGSSKGGRDVKYANGCLMMVTF